MPLAGITALSGIPISGRRPFIQKQPPLSFVKDQKFSSSVACPASEVVSGLKTKDLETCPGLMKESLLTLYVVGKMQLSGVSDSS